jgi:hypothetical protein
MISRFNFVQNEVSILNRKIPIENAMNCGVFFPRFDEMNPGFAWTA